MQLTDFNFKNCNVDTRASKLTIEDLNEKPKFVALLKREPNLYEKEIISKHNEAILKLLNERVTGNAKCVRNAKQAVNLLLEETKVKFTDVRVLLEKRGCYYDCETGEKLDGKTEIIKKEVFTKYFEKGQYVQLSNDGKGVMVLLTREPLERFKKSTLIC